MKDYLKICSIIIHKLRKTISREEFQELYKAANCFVRKRKLSMYQMLIYLLFTSKASMFQNISCIRRDLPKLQFPDISKQAVSKARKGILPECFLFLFRISVEEFYKHRRYLHKRWHGFYLFAVDGSKIELPETKQNLKQYGGIPVNGHQKTRVMGLLSTLYDVQEDIVVDGKLYPYGHSERMAAKDHIAHLKSLGIKDKCLVIFDRGYFAKWLCEEIESQGFYYLIRTKTGSRAGQDERADYISEVSVPRTKHKIRIRFVRVRLDNGETELLATNLLDPSLTEEDFKELYFKRWGIESKYREAKEQMKLEEFSGTTSCAVEQDLYINLLYMNLISLVKHAADHEITLRHRPDMKWHYQANRSFIIGQMKRLLPEVLTGGHLSERLNVLLAEAIKRRSQIQPDRKYERHKRPPQRKHFTNRKTTT